MMKMAKRDRMPVTNPRLLQYRENMMRSREAYVMAHHVRSIAYLEKQKLYKTYVGNPRRSVTRKGYDDLIAFLYEYYQEETGTSGTLDDALDDYLAMKKQWGRAQGTIERIKNSYESYTPLEMRSAKIWDLSPESIRKYLSASLETYAKEKRRPAAYKQFSGYLQILRAVLGRAVEKGSIQSNPAVTIHAEEFRGQCFYTKKRPDEKMFLPFQVELLLQAAEKDFPNPRASAVRFSAHTGLRAGELPCIRWTDIANGMLHIHRSQRIIIVDGKKVGYEELGWTKDEKGFSKGGRYVPLMPGSKEILNQIREYNDQEGIKSEFIFCNRDGSWITKDSFSLYLRRICSQLGFSTTNNHALRMAFNSNVLIPAGLDARERSLILGHSIQINETYYSFAGSHLYEGIKARLESIRTVSDSN